MCGIVGNVSFEGGNVEQAVRAMNQQLIQRGPDAEGLFHEGGVGLGHRRLSIIDLETGEQPMYSPDREQILVFNGEIYNFKTLRKQLEDQGSTFRTHSDTEVLLHGYLAWGLNTLLDRLEGMFAFALFNKSTQELIITRDRYGEKPLYYYHNEQKFLFASELKALTGQLPSLSINKTALNLFLSLSYIPAPYSIYEGIHKLEAGKGLKLHVKTGKLESFTYNDPSVNLSSPVITDFDKAKQTLKELLYDAVRQRMIADVPLGSFLSGGIDSSIITAIMADISDQPINTFSIGFHDKAYDESARAKLLAEHVGAHHHVQYIDYDDVLPFVSEVIAYYDEPFGDDSALPSFFVSKMAREKVTVVLTGDCADELFGGYEKYLAPQYADRFKSLPKFMQALVKQLVKLTPHTPVTNPWLRRIKKVLDNANLSSFDLHYNLMCLGMSERERETLLAPAFFQPVKQVVKQVYDEANAKQEALDKGFYTDLKVVLEGDMLAKVDRVCMKNSLEARVPFLDSKMVGFSQRLPISFKIKGFNKKYILKETFKELLPAETLAFRKKGFGVPVEQWFKGPLKEELLILLSPEYLKEQAIFNVQVVDQLVQEHLSGKENHKGKLWNLYVFQKWYQNHMAA